MIASRESIYSALFALMSGSAPFVTASRRFRLITTMQPSELPALFQTQSGEDTQQARGIPPKYTLRADVTIYAYNPELNQPATPQLNALVDAVEHALAPNPATGLQTLGGFVSHCYISGKTDYFDGVLGNQAIAVLPIEIVTT